VGWRDALITIGVIMLIVLVPLALLIRQPSQHPATATSGLTPEHRENASPTPLAPNVIVIWMSAAVIFCCICMSVPLMHLVPLIQDRGIPLEQASSVLFLMLVAAIAGRIFFGKLADIIGAIPAYMTASLWQTALVFVFLQFETLNSFYVFSVIYGFGYAGVMTGILVCCRVLTPIARRASALGIITMFGWVGHGIGGFQGGHFFDLTGDYTVSYANAALAGVINLIIVGTLYITISRRRSTIALVQ
jgi:predicted MFS family arabinose efflux permease